MYKGGSVIRAGSGTGGQKVTRHSSTERQSEASQIVFVLACFNERATPTDSYAIDDHSGSMNGLHMENRPREHGESNNAQFALRVQPVTWFRLKQDRPKPWVYSQKPHQTQAPTGFLGTNRVYATCSHAVSQTETVTQGLHSASACTAPQAARRDPPRPLRMQMRNR